MTKEEAIEHLKLIRLNACMTGSKSFKEVLDLAIVALSKPSLPSNLDEAAEKYANKEFPDEPSCGQWGTGDYEPPVDMEYSREIAKDSFKAGAEWQLNEDSKKHYFIQLKTIKDAWQELKKSSPEIESKPAVCFYRGAEWVAGQGVSMQITDDTEWEEVDSFIHKNVNGCSIIQIRKK